MTRAQRRNRAKAANQTVPAAAPEERKPLQIALELRGWAKVRRSQSTAVLPFTAAQHPPGTTGNAKNLAMDEAPGVGVWAQEGIGAYFGAYGYFPGFPQLAIQSQIPEIRRMVEIIATESVRKFIKLQASGEDKADKIRLIEADMKRFRVRDCYRRMLEGDGYMGRGHLLVDLGATTSDELATPIGDGSDAASKAKVRKGKLKGFKVVEAMWAYPTGYNASDPLDDDWYKPSHWMVQGKRVHRTRLLTFVGREVPDLLKPAYSFGGISLSQQVKPTVDNWLRTRQSVSDLVNAFSVMVLKTQMGNTLGVADASVMDRAELFNDIRDNRGLMILNKDTEDFSNVSAQIGGLSDLQAQSQEHMAALPGIPLVKFFGLQPKGLNASTDGEMRSFFDWIASYNEHGRPILEAMLNFIQLNRFGEVDPEITFEFEPLWSMSDKELAEVRKIEADTAQVYADTGVITPAEERKRLADDPDSMYHGLDPDDLPDLQAEAEEGLEPGGEGGAESLLGRAAEGEPPEETRALDALFDRARLARDDWREGDHPRAENGQFGSGGSSGSSEPEDDEDEDDDGETAEPFDLHHDELVEPSETDDEEEHEADIDAAIDKHASDKVVLHAPLSFADGRLDHDRVLADLKQSIESHRNFPGFVSDDTREHDTERAHKAAEAYLEKHGSFFNEDDHDGHHLVIGLDRGEEGPYWDERSAFEDQLREQGDDDDEIEYEVSGQADADRERIRRLEAAGASQRRYESTDDALTEAYPAEMREIEAAREKKDYRVVSILRSKLIKRYEADKGVTLSYDAASVKLGPAVSLRHQKARGGMQRD